MQDGKFVLSGSFQVRCDEWLGWKNIVFQMCDLRQRNVEDQFEVRIDHCTDASKGAGFWVIYKSVG